jgi:hypothetical protein
MRRFDSGEHLEHFVMDKFGLPVDCLLNGEVNVCKYRKCHNLAFDLFISNNQNCGRFFLYFCCHNNKWITTMESHHRTTLYVVYYG